MSNIFADLWKQTTDLAGAAAGTALDGYAKQLTGTSPAPQGQGTPPATVGPQKMNPWLIGGLIAAGVGLIVWLVTRKG